MQNLDFSPRLRTRRPTTAEPIHSEEPGGAAWITRWRTPALLVLGFALAAFVGGMSLGLRIGRYGQVEDAVVRRSAQPIAAKVARGDGDAGPASTPVKEPAPGKETTPARDPREPGRAANTGTMANRGNSEPRSADQHGRYVILLGSFSPPGARSLVQRVRGVAGIRRVPHQVCRSSTETTGGDAVFQLTHPRNRSLQRVYIGCYASLRQADQVLRALKQAGLLNATNAQLIDIE